MSSEEKHKIYSKIDVRLQEQEKDILRGMLMGDACVSNPHGNYHQMVVKMINKEFLEFLVNEIDIFTNGPVLHLTADESMKNAEKSDLLVVNEDSVYHDLYSISTGYHDFFRKLREWYGEDGKRFPENLTLNPTIAKYWYVCDGCLSWNYETTFTPMISSSNEMDRKEFLLDLFREHGFEPNMCGKNLYFNGEDRQEFLDWLGDPLPGFEHKWATESREQYYKLQGKEFKSWSTKKAEEYREILDLPQSVIEDSISIYRNMNINTFGSYNRQQVMLACVCYSANKDGIWVQRQDNYDEALEYADLTFANVRNIRKKIRKT